MTDVATSGSGGSDALGTTATAAALLALPEPVFVFRPRYDAAGAFVDLTYEYVNDAGLALYGMERADVVGHGQLELFPSAAPLGIVDQYLRVLREGRLVEFDVPWFDENGVEGAFALTAVPFQGCVLVSAHDVTRRVLAERDLAESRREYRLLAEAATDILMRSDLEPRILWVSPSVQEVLGWQPTDLVGQPVAALVLEEDREALRPTVQQVNAGETATYRARFRCADGGWRWLEIHTGPVRDDAGDVIGRLSACRDIHEEMQAVQALRESEHRYRLLAENASDVVQATSADGVYRWVSESVTAVLGWRPEDLIGHQSMEFIHPDDLRRVVENAAAVGPDGAHRGEMRYRRPDGTHTWVSWTARPTTDVDDGRPGFVGSLVDITERKHAEERLVHAATHDPLTGLGNRALLTSRADHALAEAAVGGHLVGLLLLDVDHFKTINDSLGHAVGDALLVEAARRVTAAVRSGDLVARHGGDEIVVLMPHVADGSEPVALAERLVTLFREPLRVYEVDLYATVSVGVTLRPGAEGDATGDDLVREADTAMYAAKREGRDRVAVFTDAMRAEVQGRLELDAALRRGLEAGEFHAWYQPERDLRDGSLRAVEALARWITADGVVHEAGEFIGLAEDTGLILPIGTEILNQAVRQGARWQAAGRPLLVRVNLAPLQLAEPDLLDTLDRILATHALDPSLLCLEITETSALDSSTTVRDNLDGIRDRGIPIAIDDFGTGYGSLTYLMDYPVSVLKIDRSFVARVTTSDRDRKLVSAVLALAAELEIAVTAEGVEQPEQTAALLSMGCIHAQGYLFGRAVPGEDIPPA